MKQQQQKKKKQKIPQLSLDFDIIPLSNAHMHM